MFCLRSIRAMKLPRKHAPIRETATYQYRTYGDPDGPNYHLIQHLTMEMQREEVSGANVFKLKAFSTAIKSIHELDYPLTNVDHVRTVTGVGPGIARRIVEFIGSKRKTDYRKLSVADREELEKARAIQDLQKVNGIGPIKARMLVESGCISLKQLSEDQFLKLLPKAIQASIVYQSDMNARVTRHQAEAFLVKLIVIPVDFRSHLMGSYRRGKPTSSDIDVLLFHPSYTTIPPFAPTEGKNSRSAHLPYETHARPPPTLIQESVVAPLTQEGIIVNAFSGGSSRWRGLVKIQIENEEIIRSADFFLMPRSSEAAAFLAFTGDKLFNLDCRKRAKDRGMHLNEFGLWRQKVQDIPPVGPAGDDAGHEDQRRGMDNLPDSTPDNGVMWELIETPDETALLRELGMGYIIPERRNLLNLSMGRREDTKRSEREQPSRRLKQDSQPRPQARPSQNSSSRPPRDSTANYAQKSRPRPSSYHTQNSRSPPSSHPTQKSRPPSSSHHTQNSRSPPHRPSPPHLSQSKIS